MNRLLHSLALVAIINFIAQAHPGVGIVENSRGEIFYTDLKQVWKITPNGKLVLAVPGVHTHELFLDSADNLYGEHLWYRGEQKDTWAHYVWKLSREGRITKVIPDTEGFLENYSFARDHMGRMYWADRSQTCQRVARRNTDNTVTSLSSPCFHNIRKIEALRDGSIAVVDFQDIQKISADGKVSTVATRIANKKWESSTVDNQNSVMGIWEDRQGTLYAAVMSERLVKSFQKDGREKIVFRCSFPWAPSGGLVDTKGRLWILECNLLNEVRVERVDEDQKLTVFKP